MTFDKLKTLIADHLDIDESEITLETTFEDLGIDSLDTVELMMEVEDEFGIEVKAQEVGKSVKELVAYIDAKLA
ncbi:MAG: acyl carrier protein [Ruminococcaceae bacterium]|nr:acyl carrier protein [Oscillospiraceae bacterium]